MAKVWLGRSLVSKDNANLDATFTVARGGTGAAAFTLGALLLGNAANPIQTLVPGADGNYVRSSAGAWVAQAGLPVADVVGTLPATKGGTGMAAYTLGDLVYSSATNTLSRLAGNITATKKFLTQTGDGVSSSAAPAWGQVQSADVQPGTFSGAYTFSLGIAISGGGGVSTFQAISGTTITGSSNIFAGVAAQLGFSGSTMMQAPSDGVLTLLNAAGTGFTRQQYGGTTASFPSWKRSGTDLHARLADDSGFTNLQAASYTLNGLTPVVGWFLAQNTKGLLVQNSVGANKVAVTLDGTNVWQFGDSLPSTFNAAVSFAISTLTNPIAVGANSGSATFGMLSFNNVMTTAGGLGITAAGTTMFYVAPTGSTHDWRINGAQVAALTATTFSVAVATTAVQAFTATVTTGQVAAFSASTNAFIAITNTTSSKTYRVYSANSADNAFDGFGVFDGSTFVLKIGTTGITTFTSSAASAGGRFINTNAGAGTSVVTLEQTAASTFNWAFATNYDSLGELAFRVSTASNGDPIAAGTSVVRLSNGAAANTVLINSPAAFTGNGVTSSVATARGTGFNFFTGTNTTATDVKIKGNGDLANTNNVYGAISDRAFKQDIERAGSQWEDVKALGALVSTFRLKSAPKGRKMLGWIAQDVEKVSPGLVDFEPDGKLAPKRSLKYSIAYMKAFKALSEALVRIEALEARVNKLQKAA